MPKDCQICYVGSGMKKTCSRLPGHASSCGTMQRELNVDIISATKSKQDADMDSSIPRVATSLSLSRFRSEAELRWVCHAEDNKLGFEKNITVNGEANARVALDAAETSCAEY